MNFQYLPVPISPLGWSSQIHPAVKATMLVPEPKHRGTMKEADRTYQQKTWEFMQEMVVECKTYCDFMFFLHEIHWDWI